jgi:hypothetical protein
MWQTKGQKMGEGLMHTVEVKMSKAKQKKKDDSMNKQLSVQSWP